MVSPNDKFTLTVEDIELIETALRYRMNNCNQPEIKNINRLLGRIHHQKNWYVSKDKFQGGG